VLKTGTLAPGPYSVLLWCDGCARELVPFTVRGGEDVALAAQLSPGVRLRLELDRADGAMVSRSTRYSLSRGDVVLADGNVLWQRAPPVPTPEGRMPVELWLRPGEYRIDVSDAGAAARAQLAVGEREGPPQRLVLR
jgi:hypothetical protein